MIAVKKRYVVGLAISVAALVTGSASAHVVVKPADALTGTYQNFSVSVPNEKEVPVTEIKLQVPDSLQSVTPTVKPGWTINVDKVGSGEDAKVKSITWTGGSVPAGLRDDFGFSAKTPDKATDLQWKAFQTYEGGVTVAWDQAPSAGEKDDDASNSGPYSVTKVTATSAPVSAAADTHSHGNTTTDEQARLMSILALAVAFVAFVMISRLNVTVKEHATRKTKK